jgi:hypothetical protein
VSSFAVPAFSPFCICEIKLNFSALTRRLRRAERNESTLISLFKGEKGKEKSRSTSSGLLYTCTAVRSDACKQFPELLVLSTSGRASNDLEKERGTDFEISGYEETAEGELNGMKRRKM